MSVRISTLDSRTDARGASYGVSLPFSSVSECHVATVRPGSVRGNHFHHNRREVLVVLYSDRWTLLWDEGDNTAVQSRTYDGRGALLVEIDPLSAHAVRNDGASDLQLFSLGDLAADETSRRELTQPVPRLAGVDGCRAGWLAVVKDATGMTLRLCTTDAQLFELFADCSVVAIDIPIGLLEKGARACDEEARRVLKQKSSVFAAPIRPILDAATDSDAQAIARRVQDGKGLQYTTVALRKSTAQIDRLLQTHPDLRERVFEVHPELSFTEWNGEPLPDSKRKLEGLEARRALVTAHFGELPPVPRGASEDDLLDAFAALWTAERIAAGRSRQLGSGETDATGLPMRIVV